MYKYLIIAVSLFFVSACISRAQNNNDSITYITFEQTLSLLEIKYHVQFFYDTLHLNPRMLNRSITDLPLDESLKRICNLSGYNVTRINKASYIFLPFDRDPGVAKKQAYQDYYNVGNPLDYGRYKNALIKGTLVDAKTGDPLIGALIYDEKYNITVVTDKKGAFSITLPVGDHELQVKYLGYEDATAKIRVYGNGSLALELIEKSIILDEVAVMAEMSRNNVMHNQMSIVRIDAKTIKELPVTMGETDIIKSVTLTPGVQSTGEFGAGFNVRGGSVDQNLILLEDLPLFYSSHVFGLISVVNPDDISNVTLLKAGIPAQFGERVSSILDIRGNSTQTDKWSAKGGIGLINSRLSIKVPLVKNKMTLSVGGRSSYSDWLLHMLNDVDLLKSSTGFFDFNAMLSFKINNANRISLFGYISGDRFKFSNTTVYQYNNALTGGKWNHIFNNSLWFSLMAGRSIYNLNVDEDINNTYDYSKIKSSLIYDCLRWNFEWQLLKKHKLNFGVNALRYKNSPGKLFPGSEESLIDYLKIQDEQAIELSGYLSDGFVITKQLSIEGGARFTKYFLYGPYELPIYDQGGPRTLDNLIGTEYYGPNKVVYSHKGIEPRVSGIYKVNEKSSVKASYTKMQQYLNLISNTNVMVPTDVWKLSNNMLQPLSCNQYAIGYYRTFPKKQIEGSLEIYYKHLDNIIEYKEGARLLVNTNVEADLVNAEGYNYGIELYVTKNTGRLTGWVSYTYSKSVRRTTSPYNEDQVLGNKYFPSSFDKPHNLVLSSNYHLSRRWRFSATYMYNTGRPITLPELKYRTIGYELIYYSDRNKYRLPDYHRLDVALTFDGSLKLKQKWKGSWTLSIVNLYSRKNAYSLFYQSAVPGASNNYKFFAEYKLYIIGKPFPTLTYNFTF